MFKLHDVWKERIVDKEKVQVLAGLTAVIPSDRRVAILGLPRSGKSTLMRVLCGLERPEQGQVTSTVLPSFPIGRPLPLVGRHSLRRNCAFVARIYSLSPSDLIRFVSAVGHFDRYMDVPISKVSQPIAVRFNYILSYALPFQTYLVDGDPLPRGGNTPVELERLARERFASSGLILATSSIRLASDYCDCFAVLANGRLEFMQSRAQAMNVLRDLGAERDGDIEAASRARVVDAKRAAALKQVEELQEIADLELSLNGETSAALWMQGQAFLTLDDRDNAARCAIQACESDPVIPEAWSLLFKLAHTEKDPANARLYAMRLQKSADPRHRGFAERLLGRAGGRTSVTLEATAVEGDRAETAENQVSLTFRQAKLALASGQHERVEELASLMDEGRAAWLQAEIAMYRGDRAVAAEQIRKACDSVGHLDEPWASLAKLVEQETDPAQSLSLAKYLLRHRQPRYRRIAAKIIERHDHSDAALAGWRAVLAAGPDDLGTLLEYAEAELLLGDPAESLAVSTSLVTNKPLSWRSLYVKARAEAALKRHDELKETLTQLSALRPDLGRKFARDLAEAAKSDVIRL